MSKFNEWWRASLPSIGLGQKDAAEAAWNAALASAKEPEQPAFDASKPVQTRDGNKARVICSDSNTEFDLIAEVYNPIHERWMLRSYKKDGQSSGHNDANDLINTPPKTQTRKRWVNVYPDDDGDYLFLHESRNHADHKSGSGRIACVPVEITYTEGEGL